MEGSERGGWATAIAGGSEEVVGEVLAKRAVLFAADSAVGTMRNRGDNTNYRKLAEHKICYLPSTLTIASMIGTLKFFSS